MYLWQFRLDLWHLMLRLEGMLCWGAAKSVHWQNPKSHLPNISWQRLLTLPVNYAGLFFPRGSSSTLIRSEGLWILDRHWFFLLHSIADITLPKVATCPSSSSGPSSTTAPASASSTTPESTSSPGSAASKKSSSSSVTAGQNSATTTTGTSNSFATAPLQQTCLLIWKRWFERVSL